MFDEKRIGFMQGRLSPLINGKIQAFPWPYWEQEFDLAAEHKFALIEWTLDQDKLYENPFMTLDGQKKIKYLCEKWNIHIPSLTGDCFMQAPFWKARGEDRQARIEDFKAIIDSAGALCVRDIVVPLVDNGHIDHEEQIDSLCEVMATHYSHMRTLEVRVVFESDLPPHELSQLIALCPDDLVGINYDTGNSASLGYQFEEELDAYHHRIYNVHIKDRVLGGTTVPLGQGQANIPGVLNYLKKCKYSGNFILQTARATNEDHLQVLCHYRDQVMNWLTV